ncbi:hypothetical protein D3C74_433130 [compost metagenome]
MRTRSRVEARTFVCPFATRETVCAETPACLATSLIDARGLDEGSAPGDVFDEDVMVAQTIAEFCRSVLPRPETRKNLYDHPKRGPR